MSVRSSALCPFAFCFKKELVWVPQWDVRGRQNIDAENTVTFRDRRLRSVTVEWDNLEQLDQPGHYGLALSSTERFCPKDLKPVPNIPQSAHSFPGRTGYSLDLSSI